MERERDIEHKFVKQVKSYGGLAIKFKSPGHSGVPDRIVFCPDGRIRFVEIKAPGKKMTPLQRSWAAKIEKLTGSPVPVVDSEEKIRAWVSAYLGMRHVT